MTGIDPTTPQLKALKVYTDAIAARDLSSVEPHFSKDCKFMTFPTMEEHPDMTKEQYLKKFGGLFRLFEKIEINFYEVIEAPGKLVTHHTILFTTADGTAHEYDAVSFFTFAEEDGELKFVECKDFTDPDKRDKFYAGAALLLGVISE